MNPQLPQEQPNAPTPVPREGPNAPEANEGRFCRCGHRQLDHRMEHDEICLICPCPEYRALETAETITLFGATIHGFHWDNHAWARTHAAIEHLVAGYRAGSDRQLGAAMAVTALPACIVAAAMALDAASYGWAAAFVAGALFTAFVCVSLITAHNERTRK
jgi:hypothetical protein